MPQPLEDAFDHARAPYVDALRTLVANDWQRFHVPAHQGHEPNAPGVAALVGAQALTLDFPMSIVGIDQRTWRSAATGSPTPLSAAQVLAADAWGATRTWFLTNGASGGNHVATMVARALGRQAIVQRSVHSSVIDGIAHVGLTPHFLQPAVDDGLNAALGVTPAQVAQALAEHPDAASVFIVSPSYFGTAADIRGIADVAHRHGVPLIVDEAWGAHFGVHVDLPVNAARLGADLVVSSTHKGAGALTQAAMLHLGHGEQSHSIEDLVDRVVRSFQSTSSSALLLASLDETRRHLMTAGQSSISEAIASADTIRARIGESGRYSDATPQLSKHDASAATDPLKVVIDMRAAGITGNEAQHVLIRDHRIYAELATPTSLLLLIGATSPADPERLLTALEALPTLHSKAVPGLRLPAPAPRALGVQEAFLSRTEIVSADDAIGRVSADSLAAYPPGVPNSLPGEILTKDVVEYLRAMAAAPSGFVRGAVDPRLDTFRVVA
ncbi:Arginine/lysine/ornithine decarboxylase [Microbacterium testaceum StLB037]|uniref:Arginine/lysine/ornithine decarboxylase n=1 Tax=Microbacterium testaceum (strain StLB037) TaxID=979556 RepID=A0A1H0QJC7_MICTS|nr:aminotransferase class V-fold PLP-dependent enzyme [Microbacterium testaceum]SDP17165.1 Arginine/lysine/ornithine decarboxylase [Microbacterium testaceum StLB037]